MSLFTETWKAAMREGAEVRGLRGAALAQFVRKAIERACGPLPIKVAAGRVTDVSNTTDGRPIYKLEP